MPSWRLRWFPDRFRWGLVTWDYPSVPLLALTITLSLAAPLNAQVHQEDVTKTLILGGLALHAVDLSQTSWGIGSGRTYEANPLARRLVYHPEANALVKMGTAGATAFLNWQLIDAHPRLAFWLAVGTDTLIGMVVAQNARAIR